ncbi:hypothetical protein GT755_09855 [Herbidospora sp. NEAU-GS84]|uniref:Uncharacterized protein n=1 Tax=Herbidospora solisilvae TaxID=2696284 RepID=A0A7C9J1N4_9ACTN|nr:hypothetical protein [Herbidospora solisilvae]NAS21987.1 hypothetical protein [Herbidospora solisilvae]
MAKLSMTAKRWDEITALLNDEQRLQAEYPKVANYLDMATSLPGTGDAQTDAAFDLRFVHYMTGGKSLSPNPYWDIVEPLVFEHEGRRVVNGGRAEVNSRLAYAQIILQETYAYAIPSPKTIEWISHLCTGHKVVELGAGRGYWAAQMAASGLSVEAYDLEPPHLTRNVSFPEAVGTEDVWHPVNDLVEFAARPYSLSECVLFLCWPPGWGDKMSSEALTLFEESGGRRLIYIGEPQGGKTGNDTFFNALSTGWRLDAVDPHFVSWGTEKDIAQSWARI